MNYTLFAERDITSLEWLLKSSGFKSKCIDINTINVDVSNKCLNLFIKNISLFISTICYKDSYKKYLKTKLSSIEERVIEKIATIDVENNDNKLYMVENISILLKEYFKNNDTLCLDSFLIFNATGFSKDIAFLAQMYCDSYDDEMGNYFFYNEKNGSDFDDKQTNMEIEDLLEFEHIVRNTSEEINLPEDIMNIRRIDLLDKNNKLILLADETKKLELSTLKKILCIDEGDDIIDDVTLIYILVGCIALFDIEQVVIHRNINKNRFEYFLRNLLLLKEFGAFTNTKIFKCKEGNCPKCNIK